MKNAVMCMVIATTSLVAAPTFADGLVAETRIQTSYPTDSSYDYVSERNALTGFDLAAGWEFSRLAGLRTLLVLQSTGQADTLFQGAAEVQWARQRVLGVLDWGVEVWPWLRPFARLGLGYAHQFAALEIDGPRLSDHAHDLAGLGSAGLEFRLPLPFGSVGASSQLGYALQTPATFDEMRHDDDAFEAEYQDVEGGDPWTRVESTVGTLNTNAVFWDIGLTVSVDF